LSVSLVVAATVALAAMLDGGALGTGSLLWRAAALTVPAGVLVLWLVSRHANTPQFGAANVVTLIRAALAALLLALLGAQWVDAWWLVAIAAAAALLDSVDGALARARGGATAFGARFDMETDAFLILVLAALVWQHGKAGAWILLSGLLRYLFVAAGYRWRWLAAELPPSRRRQAVCVVQIVSLILALAPLVPSPASAAVALAGLAALAWSFAVDVAWLARRAGSAGR
jgi:phosphatidylglycerophosphate synthase